MSLTIIILVILAAFLISAVFTHRFCNPVSVIYMLDHPNDRSLHKRPVPRGGGMAIILSIGMCGSFIAFLYSAQGILGIATGVLIVAAVSLADDRFSVPPVFRFVAHVVASAVILYSGFKIQQFEFPGVLFELTGIASTIVCAVFIVWMINLYNFMDGMDGFAAGMAIAGFGAFGAMGWMAGNELFIIANLSIVAASAGFLVFNFPPARIFMGDTGSSALGLLAGTFSLWGVRDGVFPVWIALLVFSPFIVDATVTLLWRLLHRKKIWLAHKTHFYQKLVQTGWGHRKTVLTEYAIMFGCATTSVWSLHATTAGQVTVLTGWALFYLLFFYQVLRLVSRRGR